MPAATSRSPASRVEETNPFLGLRGIRLSLARPEVFRVQLRALLRAAVARQPQGHAADGQPCRRRSTAARRCSPRRPRRSRRPASRIAMPPLGIMVEVPAAAIAPEPFADAAFFSIGSNDLTQYVMAAGARQRRGRRRSPTRGIRRCCALIADGRALRRATRHRRSASAATPAAIPQAIPALLAAGPARRSRWRRRSWPRPRPPSPGVEPMPDDGEGRSRARRPTT